MNYLQLIKTLLMYMNLIIIKLLYYYVDMHL